jgi:hypothetical protein
VTKKQIRRSLSLQRNLIVVAALQEINPAIEWNDGVRPLRSSTSTGTICAKLLMGAEK